MVMGGLAARLRPLKCFEVRHVSKTCEKCIKDLRKIFLQKLSVLCYKYIACYFAPVAQGIEQHTPNVKAAGSIPAWRTKRNRDAKRNPVFIQINKREPNPLVRKTSADKKSNSLSTAARCNSADKKQIFQNFYIYRRQIHVEIRLLQKLWVSILKAYPWKTIIINGAGIWRKNM